MTDILKRTVESGTLARGAGWGARFTFTDENGRRFQIPAAGKTGTTQNWADAWTVGYTPYYTTAIWFGFDRPGNSLGLSLTGAALAGPVWGDFMREIHLGLPRRDFVRPSSGIVDATVCVRSGLLRTSACDEGAVTLPFLDGTQPNQVCDIHYIRTASLPGGTSSNLNMTARLDVGSRNFNSNELTQGLSSLRLNLDADILPVASPPIQENTAIPRQNTWLDGPMPQAQPQPQQQQNSASVGNTNPLLDGGTATVNTATPTIPAEPAPVPPAPVAQQQVLREGLEPELPTHNPLLD
jgi:penicillin-binding protein 1A